MSRKAISARGDLVDFDVLAIKEQLALNPVPVSVSQRRKFIDEKDGVRTKEVVRVDNPSVQSENIPSALNIAYEAASQSAAAESKTTESQSAETSSKKSKSKD